VTTSEILPTVMEGGYGTTAADWTKVVSTLVIDNAPLNPPDRALSTLVIEKRKQSASHSPFRSLDLDYQMSKNARLWLALVGSKEEPCATLTERP
jgi:hypothetical protein